MARIRATAAAHCLGAAAVRAIDVSEQHQPVGGATIARDRAAPLLAQASTATGGEAWGLPNLLPLVDLAALGGLRSYALELAATHTPKSSLYPGTYSVLCLSVGGPAVFSRVFPSWFSNHAAVRHDLHVTAPSLPAALAVFTGHVVTHARFMNERPGGTLAHVLTLRAGERRRQPWTAKAFAGLSVEARFERDLADTVAAGAPVLMQGFVEVIQCFVYNGHQI